MFDLPPSTAEMEEEYEPEFDFFAYIDEEDSYSGEIVKKFEKHSNPGGGGGGV
jgi:hypothetical protein